MSSEPPPKKHKAAAAVSELSSIPVEKLPPLPFAHDYGGGKLFYVRECYGKYYNLVKELPDAKKKCVTVTGTPGVGMSVFYAYFLLRLRKEEPSTWIIAMAYEDKSIAEVAVYKDESKPEPQLDVLIASSSEMEAAIVTALKEALAKKIKVLFLCDGPPMRLWSKKNFQMVVFTSPSEKWQRLIRKNYYTTFVMPLWTYEELHRAVRALRAAGSIQVGGISDDDLETRFYTFGGVARECLLPSEDLVGVAKDGILKEIHQIHSLGELRGVLECSSIYNTCHQILHHSPIDEQGVRTYTKLASPFVVEELAEWMLKVVQGDRNKLRKALDDIAQAGPLLEWLFDAEVRGVVGGGKLRLLENNATTSNYSEEIDQ